jgi:predicted methyltransferase
MGPTRHSKFDAGRLTGILFIFSLFLPIGRSHAQNAGPERDRWQRPDEVMDALGVKPGSVVADVGCGRGYFTMKLAARVGSTGKIYAEDVKDDVLADVRRDAEKQGYKQVTTVLGAEDDPRLPPNSLDAVLTVDSYHEWVDYDSMLDHLYAALKPGGLFATIDGETEEGRTRDDYHSMHRMPESMERADLTRHSFRFLRSEPGFSRPSDGKTYYFLIFQK